MRRLLESSFFAVVLLLESSAMSAPPPTEPPEPPAQKEMREQANRLVEQGRLADARDIHVAIWRLNGRPMAAFNVGSLSSRIRDFTTAAEFLTLWLDLVGSADAPKVLVSSAEGHKKRYEQARVDLQGALKQVEAIRVNVSDPGADVLVDNRRIGVSPLKFPVFVNPGQHRVVAQLGGARVEEVVTSAAGAERTVRLVLPATPATPATATRAAKSSGTPIATVPASKPSPWARWLPIGGLAATSVALGVFGGVAVVTTNSATDERTAALGHVRQESAIGCPGAASCDDFTSADGRAKTWTGLAVASFIGAGLAAVGAGAVYVFAPSSSSPIRVGVAPSGALIADW